MKIWIVLNAETFKFHGAFYNYEDAKEYESELQNNNPDDTQYIITTTQIS